jgi:hypothetical protein
MNTFDLKFSGKTIELAPNEEKSIPLNQAEEITFYAQTGAFKISVDGGETVDIPSTKRIKFPAGYVAQRLNVKDTSGNSNTLKFYCGNVSVYNTDEVSVSGTVSVSSMPDVAIAAGQSVAITGTPSVDVSTLPAVAIAAGQSVAIAGTPSVINTPSAAAQVAAIGNIVASTVFAGVRWLRVENTGGVATSFSIGGNSKTLQIGATLELPLLGRSESYPAITVDGATSACTVETIDA